MLMAPLLHRFVDFRLPYAGGCSLGIRTIDPHLKALSAFGLSVDATTEPGTYLCHVQSGDGKAAEAGESLGPQSAGVRSLARRGAGSSTSRRITLIERGDTVTENALMAAALYPGQTTIIGASPNYMVQDLCFFLQKLGVKIDGVGTTTLTIHGREHISQDVDYYPSEDPIEAMSFIAAGLVTNSAITIRRAPIEFLEIELEVLKSMHAQIERSDEYLSANRRTLKL